MRRPSDEGFSQWRGLIFIGRLVVPHEQYSAPQCELAYICLQRNRLAIYIDQTTGFDHVDAL